MTLIQTVLERKTEEGTITMVTLLPYHKHIHIGSVISLENDDIKWTVTEFFEGALVQDLSVFLGTYVD
jgi:hypothetical protein